MSYFKAKMHPIQFRLGLRPRPRWGSLQRSPRPIAEFQGPTSKGREGWGGKGKGGGRGGIPWFLLTPPDVKSWIKFKQSRRLRGLVSCRNENRTRVAGGAAVSEFDKDGYVQDRRGIHTGRTTPAGTAMQRPPLERFSVYAYSF